MVKAQQELNLAIIVNNNKKCFYINKRRAKENLPPLLNAVVMSLIVKLGVLSGLFQPQ